MDITLLYPSLLTILAIFLAIKVGMNRVETKTMTGEGESSKLLQSIRAHGNLIEYAPLALILLAMLEMQNLSDSMLHLCGSLFFLARISHAYGVSISRESTPYRLVGAVGTWLIMLIMSLVGIYTYVS